MTMGHLGRVFVYNMITVLFEKFRYGSRWSVSSVYISDGIKFTNKVYLNFQKESFYEVSTTFNLVTVCLGNVCCFWQDSISESRRHMAF